MALPKCGICLSYTSSADMDYWINTTCGHLYHYYCIKEWMDRHSGSGGVGNFSCPECRQGLNKTSLIRLHSMSPVLHVGMDGNDIKYSIKITLLGDSGCGKTSFLHTFTHGFFHSAVDATKGVDMGFKTIDFAGKKIKLTVWDCAGQDRFRAVCPSYIRNSHGILLLYSITNPQSLKNIEDWLQIVYQSAPPEVSIMLVGNKCDLTNERKIPMEDGYTAAEHFGFELMEASAKDPLNVEAVFRTLLGKIMSSLWDNGCIDSFEFLPTTVKLSNDSVANPPRQSSCGRC